MNLNQTSTILITCGPSLTDYTRAEVEALGYKVTGSTDVGVEIKGTMTDAMRLNLYLRTAYNVLYLVNSFPCDTPDELYKKIKKMPWEEVISPDEYLSVVGRIDTPSIDNTMYPGLRVKDAIVDRIMSKTDRRPNSGKERTNVVLQLYWKGKTCKLYINSSGQKISDRSYRKTMTKAPLRESLAAAILMATGYDGTQPLVCPMCGSGTFPIEAALTATHRVPALLRSNFGFMHLKGYDETAWGDMRAEALKQSKKRGRSDFQPGPIIATDIDSWAIEATKRNAQTAGVDHLMKFDVCDFFDTQIPEQPGILLMNPEYGMRMGDLKELEETYSRIGDFFKKKCAGWTGYVFTGNMDLAKKVGLRTSRRIIFFNGGIECRLLKYELYAGTKKHKP
ncbi:MAG: THUMP domain-containing class I SAM-dependent RNA methyltransferase [Planctomycetota bacterium]|jgi:putative N6-adenine-specific DNA methylase